MKKIVLKELKKVLSENEMKRVTGGYDGNCCYWKCGGTMHSGQYGEGYSDGMSQDECWDWMESYCAFSFTIQPCPW